VDKWMNMNPLFIIHGCVHGKNIYKWWFFHCHIWLNMFLFCFLEVPNFLGHHNAGTIWTTANGMVYSPILGFGYPLVDEDHNSHCEGSQWRNHVCWKWCRILNIVNACHICMMIKISVHCVINSIIGVCVPITWFQYALDYYASTQCFDNAA
jgi:hypothetical protein